jgi:hypothetical protein
MDKRAIAVLVPVYYLAFAKTAPGQSFDITWSAGVRGQTASQPEVRDECTYGSRTMAGEAGRFRIYGPRGDRSAAAPVLAVSHHGRARILRRLSVGLRPRATLGPAWVFHRTNRDGVTSQERMPGDAR